MREDGEDGKATIWGSWGHRMCKKESKKNNEY